jgi:hypothetical protein
MVLGDGAAQRRRWLEAPLTARYIGCGNGNFLMTDLLFDKLAYKDKLTASGIPEAHARAHADAMDEALRESVATKPYLETRLAQLETRLSLRMGAMLTAAVAILIGVKLLG